MTPLHQKILEKCEKVTPFLEIETNGIVYANFNSVKEENTRLLPIISSLLEQNERLVEALRGAVIEANNQLGMYCRSYKKEPFDTGILLEIHIHETIERLNKYDLVRTANAKDLERLASGGGDVL